MDWNWFLFGFEGRINRAQCLHATLAILGAMIASLLLVVAICNRSGISTGPLSINLAGISASVQFTHGGAPAAFFPQAAILGMKLLLGWCYAAISIKRLHDRSKSAWWIVPYFFVPVLYGQFGKQLGDSWPAVVTDHATFLVLLWGLFEMLCLKGTNGPNRFGADPLAPETAADMRPRWDQFGAMEFVPHSAGPSPGPHVKRGHD